MLIMALALSSSNPALFPLNRIWKGKGWRGGVGWGEYSLGIGSTTEIDLLGLADKRLAVFK